MWVSGQRELHVRFGTSTDVLSRIRDGLGRRGRRILPAGVEVIRFRGGAPLAFRTSRKPIQGVIQIERREHELLVRIVVRDAAVRAQLAMLGFERRQYEAVIDRELNEIQRDVES